MTAQGTLFIIAAPSGAGKTSLVKALMQSVSGMSFSVSYTTRLRRQGEVEGQDYCFVMEDEFAMMVQEDAFLEHAEVFGHHYGTSRAHVACMLKQGQDVVLEIDWQGAQSIKKRYPDACGIYILPPSREIVLERLQQRAQDDEKVIAHRMLHMSQEVQHCHEFDYIIVNDEFDHALRDLLSVVRTQQLHVKRQSVRQHALIESLIKD